MADKNSNHRNMNTIIGKITLKETGIGIPDLLVVIYDLDPGAKPEENFVESADGSEPSKILPHGDRIGSVITTRDGSWTMSYEDSEYRVLNPTEKRPDLLLMVLAPEDADSDDPPTILFRSKLLRINSGRNEAFLIRLTEKQLIESKINLPSQEKVDSTTEEKKQNYREMKTAQKALKAGIKEINEEFEAAENPQILQLREVFKNAILPNKDVLNSMFNFVNETNTIEEVQDKVFVKGSDRIDQLLDKININNPVPGKGIKINLILTAEDKENLQEFKFTFNGKDYYLIPESKIQEILFKREEDDGINTILFSDNPISKYCIQKSADEKCALIHTDLREDESHEEEPEPTVPVIPAGISNEDIPSYLENILAGIDSSQFQGKKDYKSQRPDEKSVQANIDKFSLQKGPADTTAFYDFHSLQIAFDYVWQQLLDETLVNLGEKIHKNQENTGRKGILQSIQEKTLSVTAVDLNSTVVEVVKAQMEFLEEVPAEISAAFDISFLEYDSLTNDNKPILLALAQQINLNELKVPPLVRASDNNPNVRDHRDIPDSVTIASILRERGERIIDNIRINKPFSTNQLLKELQERLLAKYEFTVFAANKDFHSINFGLMNTFRQKWEPISYQAGKLVKTIPLSPNEERKYSVKTTHNTKITRKQAQKNNSSLQQEINTTSRAESEIIAKAHDKSNFNMSVKLDYSKITSQLSFGKDAEKESSQTKKDFRESVIKAAQEFKEERSIEIDTEETYSSEYNESGTISNPNNAHSATYLFYELQRRYRISEQLYRVMPVVLVAQEVPSPDQITEAWIIAHDWILNRALLDDSFRNTLQYLAQKNVGDDFAIRELRKNLRQQRTLVNNLQVEFSKLKQNSEGRYSALENAIDERINEEHDKRVYKKYFWYWTNPAFFALPNPGTPPDPEMAKAQEQAASDAHKHAVEQTERMALSVQREVNTLRQLTSDYNAVMREHLDRITQTRRLITHIKENILYYMQAIWSMEPPDQRFMRLYKVQVPHFEAERTCIIQDKPVEKIDDLFAHFRETGKRKHKAWLNGKIKRNTNGSPSVTFKQLVEVADLDTMLGFKGNYMIFPLKEHNALTELMAAPYIDEAFGAMDPDEMSNINLEEFSKYICCLHHEDPTEYERLKPVLKKWLERLLADPLRNGDEIIIPTGSLFIEMLPSDKSLLEDFKLQHREWDVYKVQAEVRKMELENIRLATRLLNNEREDPDIDKKIIVEGKDFNIDIDPDL